MRKGVVRGRDRQRLGLVDVLPRDARAAQVAPPHRGPRRRPTERAGGRPGHESAHEGSARQKASKPEQTHKTCSDRHTTTFDRSHLPWRGASFRRGRWRGAAADGDGVPVGPLAAARVAAAAALPAAGIHGVPHQPDAVRNRRDCHRQVCAGAVRSPGVGFGVRRTDGLHAHEHPGSARALRSFLGLCFCCACCYFCCTRVIDRGLRRHQMNSFNHTLRKV